ncbi:hypothetical protein BC834DRAFT_897699 [Gloeopeniophorella convolvens]|nr:hypothetical protein BC834DRAFT_897699 [Gloeopeniophorella convolvens]
MVTTLRYMSLTPLGANVIDEDRHNLCEIWNRAAGAAPDQDAQVGFTHPCTSPTFLFTASGRFWGAKTYDQVIALEQSDFPPCAEVSHRPPTSRRPSTASGRLKWFAGRPQGTISLEPAQFPAHEPFAPTPPNNTTIPQTANPRYSIHVIANCRPCALRRILLAEQSLCASSVITSLPGGRGLASRQPCRQPQFNATDSFIPAIAQFRWQ